MKVPLYKYHIPQSGTKETLRVFNTTKLLLQAKIIQTSRYPHLSS
jgi:hypothetical protein